ncbi:MAG: hypothetical protein GF398_08870 [Chitinivibrionales bacterium]|nr:hypothetical protein [Chitinivibrionales bacterium]
MFDFLFTDRDSGIFRQVPLDVKGKLFTSPMPFGAYDRGNRLLKIYKRKNIDHVFMLVTKEELKKKAKRNVKKSYVRNNMTYSQYAFKDFQAPSLPVLADLVAEARLRLQNQNVVVHCHAGVGRTGVAVCCIVSALERVDAQRALDRVKQHVSINMTAEQKNLVAKFAVNA